MSKRQEMREKHRQRERIQRILTIGVVALLAVLVVGVMVWSTLPQAIGEIMQPDPITRTRVDFNTMGDPNAPVKIIEYADFQCPFCRNFTKDTEKQLIDAYINTGKVYFEYRSFADFIGEESARAAEAAYCAGDQAKFWEMHDMIYANQGAERSGALRDARLKAFAAEIKLDVTKFNECFDGGKHKARVAQDGVDAQTAQVTSTPSFFINGTLIKGAQPFSTFQQTIEALLVAPDAP